MAVIDRSRLAVSHRQSLRTTLYQQGDPVELLASPVKGTVTMTIAAGAMRTCNITMVDIDGTLSPGQSNRLRPSLSEVFLEMGIDDIDGKMTYYPLGMFGVSTSTATKNITDMGPYVDWTGTDRSQAIGAATLTQTIQTPDGVRLAAITAEIISQQCPWIPSTCYRLDDGGFTINSQTLGVGTNVWTAIQQWWTDSGCLFYCDPSGNIVGKPYILVSQQTDPMVLRPGPGTILSGFADAWDSNGVYNGATVIASYPGVAPMAATVWDRDKLSPTNVDVYGYRPAPPITSTTAQTLRQVTAAAQMALPSVLGFNRILTTTQIVDPSLDGWQIAYINDTAEANSSDIGVLGWWLVNGYTLPLDLSQPMTTTWQPIGVD